MIEVARERAQFLPLLAGNLIAVALIAILFCAQFGGPTPLWLLQAPYFATGALVAIALTPLELLLLKRLQRHVPNIFIEALLTAIASTLLGIPGGLLIGLIGALDPRSFVGADLSGLGAYIMIGGLLVAAAGFLCALVGRLVAAFLVRLPWAPLTVLGAAALNLLLAVVYLAVA